VDRGEERRMMSERIWEKRRIRIAVKWLWIEKHGRELYSRLKPINNCSTKRSLIFVDPCIVV
jgi:hypothetical protein